MSSEEEPEHKKTEKDTKQRKYTEELELQFDSISVLAPSDNEH